MSIFTAAELHLVRQEADTAARRMARRLRLPWHDRDDLRQELLADLLARLRSFDPARGSLGAFVGVVIAHHAARLSRSFRRERALFPTISLDDTSAAGAGKLLDTLAEADGLAALHGQTADPIGRAERRLSLERAFTVLRPADCDLCAELAEHSPGELAERRPNSRATLYRHIREIRLRLMTCGLSAA